MQFSAEITESGYYSLRMVINKNTNYQNIKIIYKTDDFACPYAQTSLDYYKVFAGCLQIKTPPGPPCLYYNEIVEECTQCIEGYILKNATCFV